MDPGVGPAIDVRVMPLVDGGIQVDLRGELDELNVAEVRSRLLDGERAGQGVLLDISRLDAIDAAGLALLLLARIEIEARGGRFVIQATRPRVLRALERANMSRFVEIVGSRAEALAALDPKPAFS